MDISLTHIISAAIGGLVVLLAFPAILKYHENRKPRAAARAVKAMDDLLEVLADTDNDEAKRRENELALQLTKVAERAAKVGQAS